jgi:hypothetical protein
MEEGQERTKILERARLHGRLYSNVPSKDFIRIIFERLAGRSSRLYLAAPYFGYADPIIQVQLLTGLNGATSPQAVSTIRLIYR